MTEQTPPPYPAPLYAIRTNAEMSWQDLMSLILAFFIPIVGLGLGFYSYEQAKKIGLKQHSVGFVGLIFSAVFTATWTLWWVIVVGLGILGSASH